VSVEPFELMTQVGSAGLVDFCAKTGLKSS
jgi:hypothetical protein